MADYPFPIRPELVQIAIAYRNNALIADQVLPRVTVGTREFRYYEYDSRDRFTVPDMHVGRKGRPNEVEFGATEKTNKTEDYGLDDKLPQDDLNAAQDGHDPRGQAVEGIMDLIELGREKRVADLVFSTAPYGSNTDTLSGTDQWTDQANSDPIAKILEYLDTPLMRPNTMTLGNAAWNALRVHPKIVKAIHGNSGDTGIASRQQVAQLLELDNLLVGVSRLNTNNKGQALSLSRVWGNHCSLTYLNRQANTQRGVTFGFTAQYGSRIAGSIPDPHVGVRGGEIVRAGESVRELVVAPDCGFFIQNVI